MANRQHDQGDEQYGDHRFGLRRRALLRSGAFLGGTVGLGIPAADLGSAGVPGESYASTGASTAGGDYAFYDDFEDGDLANPGWRIYEDEGDFDARVVSQPEPGGGSKALRVTETTGGGTAGTVGWDSPVEGWDGAWTLSGMFYTENVPLSTPFQGHKVIAASDPNGGGGSISVALGFRDGNNNIIPFAIGGGLVDRVESTYDPGWQENAWYHYEIHHDGNGTYTGRLWEAGSGRPSSPNAKSVGSAPGSGGRIGAVRLNGARRRAFDMDHAFMGFRTSVRQRGYFGTYYNLPESHPDMEADGTNQDLGLVQSTLPLRLTADGEREYQQFDWFDDTYRSFSRIDDSLAFGSNFFPVDEGKSGDPFHFTVHWKATAVAPSDGTYDFSTTSDDESWVFVDGELVVDNGGLHGARTRSSSVNLSAGEHTLDVFFAERHRGGSVMTFQPDSRLDVFARRPSTDLDPLIDAKRHKIDQIRNLAGLTIGREEAGDRVDQRAEGLVDTIDARRTDASADEREQFGEALERMVAAEDVTRIATGTVVGDGTVMETNLENLYSLAMGLAMGKLSKAAGGIVRKVTNSIISSLVKRFDDMVGTFSGKGVISDDVAESASRKLNELSTKHYYRYKGYANDNPEKAQEITEAATGGIGKEVQSAAEGAIAALTENRSLLDVIEELYFNGYYFKPDWPTIGIPTPDEIEIPDVHFEYDVPDEELPVWAREAVPDEITLDVDTGSFDLPEVPVLDDLSKMQRDLQEQEPELVDVLTVGGINPSIDERMDDLEADIGSLAEQDDATREAIRSFLTDGIAATSDLVEDLIANIESAQELFGDAESLAFRSMLIALVGASVAIVTGVGAVTLLAVAATLASVIAVIGGVNLILDGFQIAVGQGYLNALNTVHHVGTVGLVNTDLDFEGVGG